MNLKLILLGGVCALSILSLVQCAIQSDRKASLEMAQAQAQAQAQAATAYATAELNREVATQVIDLTRRNTATGQTTQGYVHAAETSAGASDVVPDDVAARWAAGVDGLRLEAAASRAPEDPAGSRSP
jgi:hypothetical protein